MLRVALLVVGLVSSVSAAIADGARAPRVECMDGEWKTLSEPDIKGLGLTERVDAFSSVVYGMQRLSTRHDITVVVTDCSRMTRHAVYAEQFISLPSLGGAGFVTFIARYGIYVSVAFIRNTEMPDLLREARKRVCMIHAGVSSGTHIEMLNLTPGIALRCMLREARSAGDTEYARWLDRLIDWQTPEVVVEMIR